MLTLENPIILFLSAGLISSGSVFIWGKFFNRFSPRFTTPKYFSRNSFLFGMLAMFFAFWVEKFIFNFSFLGPSFFSFQAVGEIGNDFFHAFVYAFFLVALIEETIKFFIIKRLVRNPDVDQAIDGVKIGLWIGLGFAFAENTLYFFNFLSDISSYSIPILCLTFFVRGVLSTLAHGLYGVIMGYYLSLAKFHRLYRPRFLRIAFVASVLVHGLFDFLLIAYLGPISVFLLVVFLVIALIWYGDRRSLELDIAIDLAASMPRPFLARQDELEIILSKHNAPREAFQKMMAWFQPKEY